MKTKKINMSNAKRFAFIAAFGLFGTSVAAPALAGNNHGSNNHRGYTKSYGYKADYSHLKRVNRHGVRGEIVAYGRGAYRNCFRVKKVGKYKYNPAIITVRYCKDHYGKAKFVRGSELLVHYINKYRPVRYDRSYRWH